MKFRYPFAVWFLAIAGSAWAANEPPRLAADHDGIIHGGNPAAQATASRDTIRLIGPWGSGAVVNGQFETPNGAPAWNGWTSIDYTTPQSSAWHVDTYNVVSGCYSAWCGSLEFPACNDIDSEGGYGHAYDEWLSWSATVDDPESPATVTVAATVNHNTEPGYDFSNLGYQKAGASLNYLWTADGEGDRMPVGGSVTYLPGQYVGPDSNQIRISWRVTSDGGWDDADCSYYGDGALQVDDVTVTVVNAGSSLSYFEDFEDGTLGEWEIEIPQGVGDYAHLRGDLDDLDPCTRIGSPVACFIADDIMERERTLPVCLCDTWCYGPDGYIVTTIGGAAGPEMRIHNAVRSPAIAWPAGDYSGCRFRFDVYCHEDLSANAPGIFYVWGVRSTASGNASDLESAGWNDRNRVYYGGPQWYRGGDDEVSDLLVSAPRFVQVELAVYDFFLWWTWDGDDGYPAPYFDNVSLVCYEYCGPSMTIDEAHLAQDAFPADGALHTGADAGWNHVRFDMAASISLASDPHNDPGDSIVCNIAPARPGSELVTRDVDPVVRAPRLFWILRPGPAINPSWRTNLAAAGSDGIPNDAGCYEGSVPGAPAVWNGVQSPNSWMFDLPDSNFLYPGDVLHYFIGAWDVRDGEYQFAALPADRDGFGAFGDPARYDPRFTVRALPTLLDATGSQPPILLWYDAGDERGRDEWLGALRNLGVTPAEGYDLYTTQAASDGVGNGLGGRATVNQLSGYEILLYTSGDLDRFTISNVDYDWGDPGDDIGVVTGWLELGGRSLFATGDGLVTDLWINEGNTTSAFVTNWIGVAWQSYDARPLLGGAMAPVVHASAGNPLFSEDLAWIASGVCPEIAEMDAITSESAEPLAVFGDGSSGLAAAVKCVGANGSAVYTLPYDFSRIWDLGTGAAKAADTHSARVEVLEAILQDAGSHLGVPAEATESPLRFTVDSYPNPSNPLTRIEYVLPDAGPIAIAVYDLHGRRIRMLLDESRPAGPGTIVWNGTDDQGRSAASGLYFYEIRTENQVRCGKITLLR